MSRSWFLCILQNELKGEQQTSGLVQIQLSKLCRFRAFVTTIWVNENSSYSHCRTFAKCIKSAWPRKAIWHGQGKAIALFTVSVQLTSQNWPMLFVLLTEQAQTARWTEISAARSRTGVVATWSGGVPPSWQVRHAICKTCLVGRSQVQQFWLRTQTPRQTDWSLPSYSLRQNV